MGVTSAFTRTRNGVVQGVVKSGTRTTSRSFGHVTSVEATLMLADLIREVESSSITVDDMISSYIGKIDVEKSTVSDYLASNRAISAEIGGKTASVLTRRDVQSLVLSWLAQGRAVTTIRKRIRLLSAAYRDAIASGLLESDPTEGVRVRRASFSRPNALVGNGLSSVLHDLTVTEGWLPVAAMLGLLCGLREGEVCALKVSDVDLVAKTVTVRRSIGRAPSGEYVKATKTGRVRSVPLPPVLADRLAPMLASMPTDAWLVGPSSGKWRSKWHLSVSWRRFAEEHGYVGTEGRRPTFHDLRHSYATALVASGADVKLVQSLMGHSSAAMTLDVYATCDPSRIRAASALVDGIFGN